MSERQLGQLAPEIADFLKAEGRVILAFSGGKDSLACYCALAELGIEVRPLYMQLVPGLGYIDDYMGYIERHFGNPVLKVLHPLTYHYLKAYTAQPPHRKAVIDFLRLPKFDYEDIERGVRRTLDMREPGRGWKDAWVAVGTKWTDNIIRRRSFERYGWKRDKTRKAHPVHDWRKADLIAAMRRGGVKLPLCYKMFARSFEGVDFRYLDGLRHHRPEDYRRVLEWFPLAGLEFARVEVALRHGVATVT
jgi:hypothetical protein